MSASENGMKLSLSIEQRLSLEVLLQSQRNPDGDDYEQICDIFDKIRVPDEEKGLYVSEANGMVRLNRAAMNIGPVLDVAIDKTEGRKIRAVLRDWKNFGVDDRRWLRPLKDQLHELGF